jgi:hypothetical protein
LESKSEVKEVDEKADGRRMMTGIRDVEENVPQLDLRLSR